jgi:hypothetical protein
MAKRIILTDNDSYEIELTPDRWDIEMTIKELEDPENNFASARLDKYRIDELVETLLQLKEELDNEE